MKDSQDWLDQYLHDFLWNTEHAGMTFDQAAKEARTSIKARILQEALEMIGEDDDASLVRVGGGKSEILPTEKNQLRQELRSKFNDKYKED